MSQQSGLGTQLASSVPSSPAWGTVLAAAVVLASTPPRWEALALRTRSFPSVSSSRPPSSPVWGMTLPRLVGVAMAEAPESPLGMPRCRMPVSGS